MTCSCAQSSYHCRSCPAQTKLARHSVFRLTVPLSLATVTMEAPFKQWFGALTVSSQPWVPEVQALHGMYRETATLLLAIRFPLVIRSRFGGRRNWGICQLATYRGVKI